MVVLSAVEARVIGSLIEKETTTPEYYPLSLNALLNACNQKSSREPVMELTEADVRTALFELEQRGLVRVLADARVPKFEHRLRDPLQLRRDEIAVLALLLLRGPQTTAELRVRADRMYSFDDTAAVTATLERLAARPEPVVRIMARQPGAREARWRHLLDGVSEDPAVMASEGQRREEPGGAGSLSQRVAELEARVSALEERLTRLDGHPFAAENS